MRRNTDKVAIREILLAVTNDGNFYRQMLLPTQKNLGRHLFKGRFTRKEAMKAFLRIANAADKFYASSYNEQQRGTWRQKRGYLLSVEDRKRLAAELLEDSMEAAQYYADEMQAGVKYKDLRNNPRKRRRNNGCGTVKVKRKYLGQSKTFTFQVGQYAQTFFGIGKIIAFMDESSHSSKKGKYAIARFYKGSALYDNVAIGTDDEYIDHEINLMESIPVEVQLISGKQQNPRKRKNSSLTFKDIKVGDAFYYDGQLFVKKSTRTAYPSGMPHRTIYFKNADPVETNEKESRRKAYGVLRTYQPNSKKRSMAMRRRNLHHNPRRRRNNDIGAKAANLICTSRDEESLNSAAELILAMSPVYPEYRVYLFNRIVFYDFEDPAKDIPDFVTYLKELFANQKGKIFVHQVGDNVIVTCLPEESDYIDLISESPARVFNPRRRRTSNPRRRRNTLARKAPAKRKNAVAKKNTAKKSAAQKKHQANAKKAMKMYQSGKAPSLKAAWRMVKNPRRRR